MWAAILCKSYLNQTEHICVTDAWNYIKGELENRLCTLRIRVHHFIVYCIKCSHVKCKSILKTTCRIDCWPKPQQKYCPNATLPLNGMHLNFPLQNISRFVGPQDAQALPGSALLMQRHVSECPDSKVPGANMGPIWVPSAPDGPHVGPMKLVVGVSSLGNSLDVWQCWQNQSYRIFQGMLYDGGIHSSLLYFNFIALLPYSSACPMFACNELLIRVPNNRHSSSNYLVTTIAIQCVRD